MQAQTNKDNKTEIRLKFNSPVKTPKGFSLTDPPRLVFDFPKTEINPESRHKELNLGKVQSIEAADNKGKARIVIRLTEAVSHSVKIDNNEVVLAFDDANAMQPVRSTKHTNVDASTLANARKPSSGLEELPVPTIATHAPLDASYAWYDDPAKPKPVAEPAATPAQAPSPLKAQPVVSTVATSVPKTPVAAPVVTPSPTTPIAASASPNLQNIDFRREPDGGGRIIITLPSANTRLSEDKKGNSIVVSIDDIDVPAHLKKRMDVMDFGTPVSEINVSQTGMNARVNIAAHEGFEYRTQRNGAEYTVYISKRRVSAEEKLAEEKSKKTFTGDKLSLNFQDIEVRAVLQLLADFTNKNIVVSDTVQGNITVRLKDVPWDQALDIVLQSKNLAMRENGNVIWVAPAPELDAKEKQELEVIQAKQQLEPLVTEYIAINFAKAQDLADLIQKSKGTEDKQSLLSARGKVSVDERTNTLLVQETVSQVKAIKDLVKALDIPVQQVLIESRIVVATDTYGKELGAKFGITPNWQNGDTVGIGTGNLGAGTTTYFNSVVDAAKDTTGKTSIILPGLSDRLSVNMPVAGSAGSFGFSILSKDFMVDLELSALQAENKGEVISTPRVVTSNQTKATIEQGVEIPYQEAASSGASTTSFKKAALSLEVTPQITPDEHISMDLKVSQDSRGEDANTANGGKVPTINTRRIQTKVLVENGQTIVLGGVHEEENVRNEKKVPVLGDVPVVGNLFKSNSKSNKKRELLIFVTPKIVDGKS
jgi:type IV pilus assembly protein PilQ